MSRPEDRTAPGEPIILELAPSGGHAARARVVPITGAAEIWLAERRRRAPAMAAAGLETLVLNAGVVELSDNFSDPNSLLVGDRNRLILAVLCAGYGAPPELLMTCPDCGTTHEMPFDPDPVLHAVPRGPSGEVFGVKFGTHEIRMRLPTGADIATAGRSSDSDKKLLQSCVPEAEDNPDIRDVVEAEIAARDPCAEVSFAMDCVECGITISSLLDPLALLIAEMDRCGGVLAEIDRIARAYHWSEAELLKLPAQRRRLYLRTLEDGEFDAPRRRAS